MNTDAIPQIAVAELLEEASFSLSCFRLARKELRLGAAQAHRDRLAALAHQLVERGVITRSSMDELLEDEP